MARSARVAVLALASFSPSCAASREAQEPPESPEKSTISREPERVEKGEPTLRDLQRELGKVARANAEIEARFKEGDRKLGLLVVPISTLFQHPETRLTLTQPSGKKLTVTSENIQEHLHHVRRLVLEHRFEVNPVLKNLRGREGSLSKLEAAIVAGYEMFPDNPRRATGKAIEHFVVGDRPAGTLIQLSQVLAKVNTSDSEEVPPEFRKDRARWILTERDVMKAIREGIPFDMFRTNEVGEQESVSVTSANLAERKDEVTEFMFSLRQRRNPELRRLVEGEQQGTLFPEEWVALMAIRKFPGDPQMAYREAASVFSRATRGRDLGSEKGDL